MKNFFLKSIFCFSNPQLICSTHGFHLNFKLSLNPTAALNWNWELISYCQKYYANYFSYHFKYLTWVHLLYLENLHQWTVFFYDVQEHGHRFYFHQLIKILIFVVLPYLSLEFQTMVFLGKIFAFPWQRYLIYFIEKR